MTNFPKSTALIAAFLTCLSIGVHADQNTRLVSQLGVGPGTCSETLDREGNLVAIARRHDGCVVIDVSNPQNPTVLHTIHPDLLPTYDIWDVDIHDGILYVMNRPEAIDSTLLNWVGVYIYDLNVVGPPPQIGYLLWGGGAWHHLAGSVQAGTVADVLGVPHAFLCSDITGDVEVFDMTDPSAPVYVTSVYHPTYYATSWDVRVQNGQLFTAWGSSGFTIHELALLPDAILTVYQPYTGSPVINGGIRTVAPTPDGRYLVTGEYTNQGTVRLWNLTGTVTQQATWNLGTGALLWTVRATNDFAYVAHLEDGIQILDLRSGRTFSRLGFFDPNSGTPARTWAGISDVEIDGTRIYASHQTNGLYVVDFGDTVAITKAEWRKGKKELTIWATSTGQPNATLQVTGFGTMTWVPISNRYERKVTGVTSKPASVTVVSSVTGTATATVVQRN